MLLFGSIWGSIGNNSRISSFIILLIIGNKPEYYGQIQSPYYKSGKTGTFVRITFIIFLYCMAEDKYNIIHIKKRKKRIYHVWCMDMDRERNRETPAETAFMLYWISFSWEGCAYQHWINIAGDSRTKRNLLVKFNCGHKQQTFYTSDKIYRLLGCSIFYEWESVLSV